ncbi:uroporphyrinogen-III C-methyltransferase [Spirochaeta thermophila]|uniref:Hydroxymethylbilane synthase n=1 Tax=Winmispira thermophila (strain ATCC 49972 / DSM 6192 / RI 19.B1) TaxID=665571 RepID=E0RN85_WINT6|nr:uroporphyrinogen-III C-methyltransferase [Spirochaeta thermophila]ADN02554.1 porphyrin biosynthesis protein HemD [Spirochaeta thermophila DSM 6192]
MRVLRLGTRGSRLALAQVREWIARWRDASPEAGEVEWEPMVLHPRGDRDKRTPLHLVEGSDFFTDALDEALLEGRIDVALHSAKDLPDELREGLSLAAITPLEGPREDVLVLHPRWASASSVDELPAGLRIGTSSARRREQLSHLRSDWELVDIRGTIEERLARVSSGEIDGVVMAKVALTRLALEVPHLPLPFVPHPLQGRLAAVVREGDEEVRRLCAVLDDRGRWGRVAIVGAGPGTADFLTLRAERLLREADLVLYDDLVYPELLAGRTAELVAVGRRKGKERYTVEEVCDLMIQAAYAGKKVVRLKGGDPSLYARLEEELSWLRAARIPYEVVPGISAFQAASACTEIPLTSREGASSLLISTGYPPERALIPPPDGRLSCVYYMAGEEFPRICARFLEAGWDPHTPAVVVSAAARPEQTHLSLTLEDGARWTGSLPRPALLLVGATGVSRSWWEDRPHILVTGTRAAPWRARGEVVHIPCIATVPRRDGRVQEVMEGLSSYTMLIFTSRHGVAHFVDRLLEHGDLRLLAGMRVVAIGRVTAEALKDRGLVPDLIPEEDSAEGLVSLAAKENWRDEKILIPCSSLSDPFLQEELSRQGNTVDAVPFYDTVPAPYPEALPLEVGAFDEVVFLSPSGVRVFRERFGALPPGIRIHTPGATTRRAVDDATS